MKKTFTPEEIDVLEQNAYTLKLTPSVIKFTEEFKEDFWRLYLAEIPIRDIFQKLGYDPEILGIKDWMIYARQQVSLNQDNTTGSILLNLEQKTNETNGN